MLHAANLSADLECIVEDAVFILPKDWHVHQEGVYTFIYKQPTNKKIQFRFVDNGDGNLSVNFVVEDSETLNQISLKVADDLNANAEKYQKYLQSVLDGKKNKEPERQGESSHYRPLEPVPIGGQGYRPYQPMQPAPLTPNPFPGGGLYNPSN